MNGLRPLNLPDGCDDTIAKCVPLFGNSNLLQVHKVKEIVACSLNNFYPFKTFLSFIFCQISQQFVMIHYKSAPVFVQYSLSNEEHLRL